MSFLQNILLFSHFSQKNNTNILIIQNNYEIMPHINFIPTLQIILALGPIWLPLCPWEKKITQSDFFFLMLTVFRLFKLDPNPNPFMPYPAHFLQ